MALINFTVTAKMIWVFVLAYAKSLFSHDKARIVKMGKTGFYVKMVKNDKFVKSILINIDMEN